MGSIVPLVVAHPRLSDARNGALEAVKQFIISLPVCLGGSGEELGPQNVEPKGRLDGCHESQASIHRVAYCRSGLAQMVDEVDGRKRRVSMSGWVLIGPRPDSGRRCFFAHLLERIEGRPGG